jgi:hypothetical protein
MQPTPALKPQGPGLQATAEKLFTTTLIVLGVGIGIMLAGIGKLIVIISPLAAYYMSIIGLNGAGLALLFGGFFNNKMNDTIKGGLIMAGGLMLAIANTYVLTGFQLL